MPIECGSRALAQLQRQKDWHSIAGAHVAGAPVSRLDCVSRSRMQASRMQASLQLSRGDPAARPVRRGPAGCPRAAPPAPRMPPPTGRPCRGCALPRRNGPAGRRLQEGCKGRADRWRRPVASAGAERMERARFVGQRLYSSMAKGRAGQPCRPGGHACCATGVGSHRCATARRWHRGQPPGGGLPRPARCGAGLRICWRGVKGSQVVLLAGQPAPSGFAQPRVPARFHLFAQLQGGPGPEGRVQGVWIRALREGRVGAPGH